ncbi:MAG: sugar phosphate isomerase/epimerase family protein [Candidatus Buchananbacteria bacterium]|jgi:sugar phosphate isomerase/epimerase
MQIPFKKGLFLNITSRNKSKWAKDIENLSNFQFLDFIEIWIEEIDLNTDEIAWLKQKLSPYEIIIHAPFINLSLISIQKSINEATINILKKSIDIGEQLNAKIITMHGGSFPLFLKQPAVKRIFVINFQQLINYADNKIEITIENTSIKKNTQISYPVLLNELSDIQSSIPNINFTLDVGHCIQNNDKFVNFLLKNKKYIKNIHLHNAIKNGTAHFGFNKKGDLKLKNFMDSLKNINYSNFLSLEILGEQDIKKSWELLLKSL